MRGNPFFINKLDVLSISFSIRCSNVEIDERKICKIICKSDTVGKKNFEIKVERENSFYENSREDKVDENHFN